MEIVFTRAENACGYERPLDEQLHIVEHRGWEEKKEKEREGRGEKRRERKGKCVHGMENVTWTRVLHFLSNGPRIVRLCDKSSVWITVGRWQVETILPTVKNTPFYRGGIHIKEKYLRITRILSSMPGWFFCGRGYEDFDDDLLGKISQEDITLYSDWKLKLVSVSFCRVFFFFLNYSSSNRARKEYHWMYTEV